MCPGFSTHLLDEAIEKEEREREEMRSQLIRKIFDILKKLHWEVPFDGAYLFGSITKPYQFLRYSDIDIGFMGLKDEDFFKTMSFISRELGRDVDVIQLENHRLTEKIKKEGIQWTGKD